MKKIKKVPRSEHLTHNQLNNIITKETRQEAYLTRPSKRQLEILKIMGDEEMSARMILNRSKYMDMGAIRPRLTEMKYDGLIEVTGKALDAATKVSTALYRVTEEGKKYVKQAE